MLSTRAGLLWALDPVALADADGIGPVIACRDDGSVRHVDDALRSLRDGTFWMTNLPFAVMRRLGLLARDDLRDDAFLLTRPDGLAAEMGLRNAPVEQQAAEVAVQAGRCLHVAREWFGLPMPPPGHNLALALRQHLFDFPEQSVAPEIEYAFNSAAQDVTFVPPPGGSTGMTERRAVLRHHRQDYAIGMLEAQVPAGDWREVFPPVEPAQVPRWVRDMNESRPMLLRVSAHFEGDRAADLAALSGLSATPAGGPSRASRGWIAAPEYLVLCPYARIEVHGALAADRYRLNPFAGMRSIGFDTEPSGAIAEAVLCGPVQLNGRRRMSYAVGLLCESMWVGLLKSGKRKDATSMWLGALDRAECIRTALQLFDLGLPIRVTGFSRGRIWVAVRDDDSPDSSEQVLATAAACCRLVPPVMPVAQPNTRRLSVADEMASRSAREYPHDPTLAVGALAVLGNPALVGDWLRLQ